MEVIVSHNLSSGIFSVRVVGQAKAIRHNLSADVLLVWSDGRKGES